MKRIRIVQAVGITLFLVYIGLILVDVMGGLKHEYSYLVFSIVLAIISLNLMYKGHLIGSQSTMWFAISLVLFAISIAVCQILSIEPIDYYFVFALIPIISSIINVAIFFNLFYIKVIILNISIAVPITIMYFFELNIWYIIAIGFASIVLGTLICRCLNFDKEKV